MTLRDYRLNIALRWADLESVVVKDRPLKTYLQQLRKLHEWPTCAVYSDVTGKGHENVLRFHQRKANPVFSDDDDIEIIVRRKESHKIKEAGYEVVDVVEVTSDDECGLETGGIDNTVDDNPSEFPYSGHGDTGRKYNRAKSNNDYLLKDMTRFRGILKNVKGSLSVQRAGEHADELRSTIFRIETRLASMRKELSEVPDLPRGFGTEVPPPKGFGSHACGKCAECGRCFYCRAFWDEIPFGCEACYVALSLHPFGCKKSSVPYQNHKPQGKPRAYGSAGIPPSWVRGVTTPPSQKEVLSAWNIYKSSPYRCFICQWCTVGLTKPYCTTPQCIRLLRVAGVLIPDEEVLDPIRRVAS